MSWTDAFALDPYGFAADGAPVAAVADSSAPVVTNVSPPVGTAIPRSQVIDLTVTDETSFRRIMLVAKFSTSWESVFDGEVFSPAYSQSTRTTLVLGRSYRFRVRRSAGWPEAPTLMPVAIDQGGNENA